MDRVVRCFRCHRPLRTEAARKARIGPTCAKRVKQLGLPGMELARPEQQYDLFGYILPIA